MREVQAMTVQAKDVHARAAGAKPAGRARRAWLILIAPAAEVLTSPLVCGLLRRRFGERAGYLLGVVGTNLAAEELLWRASAAACCSAMP